MRCQLLLTNQYMTCYTCDNTWHPTIRAHYTHAHPPHATTTRPTCSSACTNTREHTRQYCHAAAPLYPQCACPSVHPSTCGHMSTQPHQTKLPAKELLSSPLMGPHGQVGTYTLVQAIAQLPSPQPPTWMAPWQSAASRPPLQYLHQPIHKQSLNADMPHKHVNKTSTIHPQ